MPPTRKGDRTVVTMVHPATNLEAAIIAIKSSSGKERENAVTIIINLFERGGKSLEFVNLDHKAYHSILEAIFQYTLSEKTALSSLKKNTKNTSIKRLVLCAEAIRLVVTHGVSKLRKKSLWAIIDHATQTLFELDEELIPFLAQEYIKALISVLAYPSNVELLASLDGSRWLKSVDFCLHMLSRYIDLSEKDAPTFSRASPIPSSLYSNPRSVSSTQRSSSGQIFGFTVQDILQCLLCLIKVPNAPLLAKAKDIVTTAINVLQLRLLALNMVQQLFETVNIVISRTQADDLALSAQISQRILPEISHWWQSPSANKETDPLTRKIKAEMIQTIFFTHLHILRLVSQIDNDEKSLLDVLHDLAYVLKNEYAKRSLWAKLKLDNLLLSLQCLPKSHLQTRLMALRPHNLDGEDHWAILQALGLIEGIIWRHSNNCGNRRVDSRQPKRRKVDASFRLHESLKNDHIDWQLVTIQMIPFFLSSVDLPREEIEDLARDLVPFMSTKNSPTVNWAILALASCTISLKNGPFSESLWKSVWQLTLRLVGLHQTCRPACFLLCAILEVEALPYSVVSESIHSVVTASHTNGPLLLVDSSIAFMHKLVRLRNTHLPNASQATFHNTIHWVFSKWHPADPSFVANQSTFAAPLDLCALLSTCCDIPTYQPPDCFRIPGGSILQSWAHYVDTENMMRYLLLVEKTPNRLLAWPQTEKKEQRVLCHVEDMFDFDSATKLVLELLYPNLEEMALLTEKWNKRDEQDAPIQISTERFQSHMSFCIVSALMIPSLQQVSSRQSKELEPIFSRTVKALLSAALSASNRQELAAIILQTIRPVIPELSSSQLAMMIKKHSLLLGLLDQVSIFLYHQATSRLSPPDFDFMDLEDDFSSKRADTISIAPESDQPLTQSIIASDTQAFYAQTSIRIRYIASIYRDPDRIGLFPSEFLLHVLDLTDREFLAIIPFLREILGLDIVVTSYEGVELLKKAGEIIGKSEFMNCEAAFCACIEFMRGLSAAAQDDQHNLGGMISDLYTHLVTKALVNNSLSPRAQMELADLLFYFLYVGIEYGNKSGPPFSRSVLLWMLEKSPIAVKYFIGSRLPDLFALYALKTHDEIFVDCLEALPADPDLLEGIAVRLFALAELGCRWPTLLRRCIYHIFETPGSVADSSDYAAWCLSKVAHSLQLVETKELFHLFASQLYYTWLDGSELLEMPYQIFGFNSIEVMLKETKEEAVALMIMRGQDDKVIELANTIGQPMAELIEMGFARIMAYSIAHDFSSSSHEQRSRENYLQKILGKEQFLAKLNINLPDILGIFFYTYDDRDDLTKIAKYFSKHEYTAKAFEILMAIRALGHSDAVTPPAQQPIFKGRNLPRQLYYLSSRTKWELSDFWTPTVVVAICRRLFNAIHPALGSLHACIVIRRIRVIMAVAGESVYEPYPLEMLLHSLRPYVVDSECADDALGMSKYLLGKGIYHLRKVPSFIAGYALSLFASLRVFLDSSQSNTIPESQFIATKTKVKEFHVWFIKYLAEYNSPVFQNTELKMAFKTITESAAQIRGSGNAEKGTAESNLLLQILKDSEWEVKLLDPSSRKLALAMLCRNFQVPSSSRSDVIESDQDAIAFSFAVWDSCRGPLLSDEYLSWAGRVVGRSFAASGEIPPQVLKESNLHPQSIRGSESVILSLIRDLTKHKDSRRAGLAESTLRNFVTLAGCTNSMDHLALAQEILGEPLTIACNWQDFQTPPSDVPYIEPVTEGVASSPDLINSLSWASRLGTYLAGLVQADIVLQSILPLVAQDDNFARKALPGIIHLALLSQLNGQKVAKRVISALIPSWLGADSLQGMENIRLLIKTVIYLRGQVIPGESSIADRLHWLDLDLADISAAATRVGMFKTSLLLAELASSGPLMSPRQSTGTRDFTSLEELTEIYQNIDDPDAYYGLPQDPTLSGVLSRLEYEDDGAKSLAFRGAQFDSNVRMRAPEPSRDSRALVKTLGNLGLWGLSHSLLQSQQGVIGLNTWEDTFTTARRLEIWNLPAPVSNKNHAVILYTTYQEVFQSQSADEIRRAIHIGLGRTMRSLISQGQNITVLRRTLGTLAAISELDDMLSSTSTKDLNQMLEIFHRREQWMRKGRYDDVRSILSSRVTTMSMVERQARLSNCAYLTVVDARIAEIQSMILSSRIYRFHGAAQESLNMATMLTDLIEPSRELGLEVDVAVKAEAANALWDQGERISSIRLLQNIEKDDLFSTQTITSSRSVILARTAYQVSAARLEKPDWIQKHYLEPALQELRGQSGGSEAGQVYHQFAVFCDEQLQSPDGLEDLTRLRNLRKGKHDEVQQLTKLYSSARETQTKTRYQKYLNLAQQWLTLDEQELRRVEQTRAEFVRLSLVNYLLGLAASDEFNNDALRFTALWMEQSGDEEANKAVQKHLEKVPTRKFAPLMNQLASRLANHQTVFQQCLAKLILCICNDHPFHGMYQIWAATKAKVNQNDDIAVSRQRAACKVASNLAKTKSISATWQAVDRANTHYHRLAHEKDVCFVSGRKLALSKSAQAAALSQTLTKYKLPPCTMEISLSADRNYSHVPIVTKLDMTFSIASGISAPKIVTAIATDGKKYKQLVKGGNDDLRQDAIMEQVFSAVSSVLQLHKATQQRNLLIRTYKVLPITSTSGVIEFVPNTIPLHDYLIPAHEKYYPRDLKSSHCRKEIHSVQNKSLETRLNTFKRITEKFHPVMRYFFLEYFSDPDDWYVKRLAYTRSTAAASIVGHVMGLGDRHGHNILLDTSSGEAVHIDLGILFEQGRILPVPEVIPFRLTRDIVDGMGITGTEGVFRRCCEFTLNALREEEYTIMTVLDVLRHDPLYSWSVSPVRLAKLQAAHDGEDSDTNMNSRLNRLGGAANQPSEADRALEVVRKKLSKTLSVNATVNDLINQATDEKNLAVLYSGWAAYV